MKTDFIALLKENVGKHVEGKAAPFSNWLNGKIISINDAGDLEMAFQIRQDMLNPFGVAHGGTISAILDELMGTQLYIKTSYEDKFLALNLTVDFIKATKVGEFVYGAPIIVKQGRRVATLTCQLKNENGVVIAQASSNYMAI